MHLYLPLKTIPVWPWTGPEHWDPQIS